MEWVTVAGFVLTGGIGKAIMDQIVRGWRQREQARGNQDSKVDALKRSRLWWMERTYAERRRQLAGGLDLLPIDEAADPYLAWENKHLTASVAD